MIQLANLSLELGGRAIFQNLELRIQPGEFLLLAGKSGSGKSSLLRLLAGDLAPTRGKILIEGVDLAQLSPSAKQLFRRKVGVVWQDFRLLPRRTVFENISFPLEVCGFSQEEIAARLPELLEITGLAARADAFPAELSGGEAQRTALARALAARPVLLLADEPTGALDAENAREVVRILLAASKEGTTVVAASHRPELFLEEGGRKIRRIGLAARLGNPFR